MAALSCTVCDGSSVHRAAATTYPIDVLKIDRSFITHITTNDHEDRATALRALGCPGAQGWLYSQAIPPEQVTALLGTTYLS